MKTFLNQISQILPTFLLVGVVGFRISAYPLRARTLIVFFCSVARGLLYDFRRPPPIIHLSPLGGETEEVNGGERRGGGVGGGGGARRRRSLLFNVQARVGRDQCGTGESSRATSTVPYRRLFPHVRHLGHHRWEDGKGIPAGLHRHPLAMLVVWDNGLKQTENSATGGVVALPPAVPPPAGTNSK